MLVVTDLMLTFNVTPLLFSYKFKCLVLFSIIGTPQSSYHINLELTLVTPQTPYLFSIFIIVTNLLHFL